MSDDGTSPSRSATNDTARARPFTGDAELARDAAHVVEDLHAIRRAMMRSIEEDQRQSRLTAPQTHALDVLTRPDVLEGLSLKELSARMGLAHSTVSGIVARLERRGLVRRLAEANDRRVTRIAVAEPVRDYVREGLPQRRLGQVIAALARASEHERTTIVDGLAALRRLLVETPH